MRDVPQAMSDTWRGGDFTGDRRPIARVTLQQAKIELHSFSRVGGVYNTYASLPFGPDTPPKELPNVRSVSWDRDAESEIASCRISLANTQPQPVGTVLYRDLDQPGYFTFNRGDATYSSRWAQTPNEWSGLLLPDNIVRTYEGYGFDEQLCPEDDTHLMLTGCWLIDQVSYTADGLIEITARDFGRVLADQIAFTPVVPANFNPLTFTVQGDPPGFSPGGESENQRLTRIINDVRLGQRTFDDIRRSVDLLAYGPNRHYEPLPVDPARDAPFLTLRSQTKKRVEQIFTNRNVVLPLDPSTDGAPPRVEAGAGQEPGTYSDYSDIVKLFCAWGGFFWPAENSGSENAEQRLNRIVADVYLRRRSFDSVRVSVDRLAYGDDTTHYEPLPVPPERDNPFRNLANLTRQRIEQIFSNRGVPLSILVQNPGATMLKCDGSTVSYDYGPGPYGLPNALDPVLGENAGRVWGDFMQTGTHGKADLTAENFDKKSLLDCIVYIREIIGFLFYIDETGACVWRMPNIFQLGNNVATATQQPRRTTDTVVLDESVNLMDLSVTLSSRNIRERVFIANSDGSSAGVARTINPNPIGLRRVAGWTDQNFESKEECQLMADLIALRQLFSYRADRLTIPGYPKIQVDDQVKVFEQVTGEAYTHYVSGISSSLDHENGEYTYALTTQWLGEQPFSKWAFDPAQFSELTRSYLAYLGLAGPGPDPSTPATPSYPLGPVY